MAGTSNITQTNTSIVCQSEGTGSLDLNSLDSVDVDNISDGALAQVQVTDAIFKWYPLSVAAPNAGTVVKPITVPLASPGRWLVQTSAVPVGVFYQFITNIALNTGLSPVQNPIPQVPVQAPILEFYNLQASGDASKTVITASNQQIVYLDAITPAAPVVENQRARIRLNQLATLSADSYRSISVADDAANDETIINFFNPGYQEVQYGANTWHSKKLRFQGTSVSVADSGTGDTTVVSIYAAAAIAPWGGPAGVLASGNSSSGNDVLINQADTLYIKDAAKVYVQDGGTIQFVSASNQLVWVNGGVARIYYAGGGPDAGGAPLILQSASHSGGNVGAAGYIHAANTNTGGLIRFSAGNGVAALSSGGAINMDTGGGTSDGGNFNVTTGAGAGGIGGFAVFTLGAGTTTGGGFEVVGGAGGVQGGGIEFTSGSGPTSGAIRFTVGAGGVAADFIVTGGLGATAGSELRFTAGATTAGAGGSIHHTGGDGTTAGGNYYFSGGTASAGPGGSFSISGGQGTDGGGFSFTGGTASVDKGGGFSVTGGDGINDGGRITLQGGSRTVGVDVPATLEVLGASSAGGGSNGRVELGTSLLIKTYPVGGTPNTDATAGSLYANNSGGKVKLFWKYSDGTTYQITP